MSTDYKAANPCMFSTVSGSSFRSKHYGTHACLHAWWQKCIGLSHQCWWRCVRQLLHRAMLCGVVGATWTAQRPCQRNLKPRSPLMTPYNPHEAHLSACSHPSTPYAPALHLALWNHLHPPIRCHPTPKSPLLPIQPHAPHLPQAATVRRGPSILQRGNPQRGGTRGGAHSA